MLLSSPVLNYYEKNPPTLSFLRVGGCGRNGEAAENRGFAGSMDTPYEKNCPLFILLIQKKSERRNDDMGQDQFAAIMPYISADLVGMIVKKKNISEPDAITKLYNSKLYAALEQEDTKVWQYSTDMLYSLLEQEERTGEIEFPDV